MLKPSATKVAAQTETERLIAEFKAKGGVIATTEPGVGQGLRKRKYLK